MRKKLTTTESIQNFLVIGLRNPMKKTKTTVKDYLRHLGIYILSCTFIKLSRYLLFITWEHLTHCMFLVFLITEFYCSFVLTYLKLRDNCQRGTHILPAKLFKQI